MTPGLSVQGLSAGYGARKVIHEIAFAAPRGQVTALLGPNGAGKSTVLKAVLGLQPCRGEVLLDGVALESMAARQRAQQESQSVGPCIWSACETDVYTVAILCMMKSNIIPIVTDPYRTDISPTALFETNLHFRVLLLLHPEFAYVDCEHSNPYTGYQP